MDDHDERGERRKVSKAEIGLRLWEIVRIVEEAKRRQEQEREQDARASVPPKRQDT